MDDYLNVHPKDGKPMTSNHKPTKYLKYPELAVPMLSDDELAMKAKFRKMEKNHEC
jgi:hypothetical protein